MIAPTLAPANAASTTLLSGAAGDPFGAGALAPAAIFRTIAGRTPLA